MQTVTTETPSHNVSVRTNHSALTYDEYILECGLVKFYKSYQLISQMNDYKTVWESLSDENKVRWGQMAHHEMNMRIKLKKKQIQQQIRQFLLEIEIEDEIQRSILLLY